MSWLTRVRRTLNADVRDLVRPKSPAAAPRPAVSASPERRAAAEAPSTVTPEPLGSAPAGALRHARAGLAAAPSLDLFAESEAAAESSGLPALHTGDRLAECYEIRRILGRSSTTAIYLARHERWKADVVLRIPLAGGFDEPLSARTVSEAAGRWTALGLHPHVAYCHYVHGVDGAPVVVVEYVDGGSLRQWIADGRSASLRAGLNLAMQICHGLEHMHAAGLVHGALKPENVLVAADGTAKVTDLGVAGWGRAAAALAASSPPPSGPGGRARPNPAAYVAPEQWVAGEPIDSRADVFALGVLLYEMLGGGRPYEVARGPRREAPEPRPAKPNGELPPELIALMRQCVDWERDQRPGAYEVRRRLSEIYATRFGKASPFAHTPPTAVEADGWNNRGMAAEFFAQHDDALEAWNNAVNVDPAHVEATYNRGVALWRRALATDEEVIQRLAQTRPGAEAWKSRYLLALAHLESGQTDVAAELLKEAARENPYDSEVAAALELARSDQIRPARAVRAFQAHAGYVAGVCFGPDGRQLYSAGADQSVRQWDVETSRCVRTFDGHRGHVASIDATADGRLLLTSSDDGTLRVWDASSGRCLQVLDLKANRVFTASLSGDGRLAACAFTGTAHGAEGTAIELWDLIAKRRRGSLAGHTAATKVVTLSRDGTWVVSGGDDKTVRLWDASTARELRVFRGHEHFVSAVAISADGHFVVSGSWDKTLRLWEVSSGHCLRVLVGHGGLVNAVRMSPDGRWIISGGWDGTVRLWETASGRCLHTFTGHSSMVSALALSPSGALAASGSWDRGIRLWQIPEKPLAVCTYQLSLSWRHDAGAARQQKGEDALDDVLVQARAAVDEGNDDLALTLLRRCRAEVREADGELVLEETMRLWRQLARVLPRTDLRDVRLERTLAPGDVVNGGDLSADGRLLLTACRDQTVRLWNAENGAALRTFSGHGDRVLAACLSPDGRRVLSGAADRSVRLWNAESGEPVLVLSGHTSVVSAVCFSADGGSALSASYDHTLRSWNLVDGTCFQVFRGHRRQVTSIAVSADGLRAISGGYDNAVCLWETRTGKCLRSLQGHTRAVTSVSLSPDGGWALSASQDRSVRLWDLRASRCVRVLEGHEDAVSAVQFSPDGRWAFSASWDRTIRVWDLSSGRCWGVLEGYPDKLTCLRLSGDGLWLVSASADKTVRLWELDWELESPAAG